MYSKMFALILIFSINISAQAGYEKLVGMKCSSFDSTPIPYYGNFRIVIGYNDAGSEYHSVKKLVTERLVQLIPVRRNEKASTVFSKKSLNILITHEAVGDSKFYLSIDPDEPQNTYYGEFGYTNPEDRVQIKCDFLSDEETNSYRKWKIQDP